MPSKYAGVALGEHHALPPSARAADEVLAIGCAAVITRDDRECDRRGPFVRGVGMIDPRDGIQTELGSGALMARVGCHHGEAALQAGLWKRSRVAPDSRGDDAIVATTALIQEPATPRGRQSQFETGLVRLAIRARAWRGRSAHDAMRRLCVRAGIVGRAQRREPRDLSGGERRARLSSRRRPHRRLATDAHVEHGCHKPGRDKRNGVSHQRGSSATFRLRN